MILEKDRSVPRGLTLIAFIMIIQARGCSSATSGKVVDFGDKLPDYIKENPHKGWLIKFYTPWCYNCQQIELTYIEVAEKIYHAHDQLVVGQVNCDKYEGICRQFEVTGVPTIIYLRGKRNFKYTGRRDVSSIVSFAERMNGPDVNIITECSRIIPEIERRGTMIVHSGSADLTSTDKVYRAFNAVAVELKRDFWFYRLYNNTCGSTSYVHSGQGVFIVKRNLHRWIKFEPPTSADPEESLREFIERESFPVFGPLSNNLMNTTKLLAVAVLNEYAPAKKLDALSKKFYKIFEQVATEEAQKDDQILFAWSTDLHSIRKIALSSVTTPNVILLRQNLSHNLLLKSNDYSLMEEEHHQIPEALSKDSVLKFIRAARDGELEFTGGDAIYQRLARYIYSYIILVMDRYEANPVLTSLMMISMATTTMVLLYKTKTYLRDDEENIAAEVEFRTQANHRKRD